MNFVFDGSDKYVELLFLAFGDLQFMESLADAKISASELQDILKEKDKKIAELEDLLKFKGKIIRNNDRYFETGKNNLPINDPFCSNCWDSECKRIYLISPQ